MRSDSGSTISIWMDSAEVPDLSQLEGNVEVDACVIGAGLAGMSTAYLLARDGRRVLVLDDGPIGGGETCRTTAHLTNVIDDRYHEIERMHGERGARHAADSHTAAIDLIGRIAADERIECGYQRLDAYLYAPPEEDADEIEREFEAATRAGVSVVRIEEGPLGFVRGPCLRFPEQGAFHPLRYLAGLAQAIERLGGRIARAHVVGIEDGEPAVVTTEAGMNVRAREVVVATNGPIHARLRYHTQQAPYRTFAIAAAVPRGSVPDVLLYDTCSPYHYVRLERTIRAREELDLLVVGGEDHKTGQSDDGARRFHALEAWARERFPSMREVQHLWSGQVFEPVDGVAMMGRDGTSDHVSVITGDSGMGMTHCTIGAMLIADRLAGRPNPWAELYDPRRTTLGAAVEYVKENVNVAIQLVQHLTPGEVRSIDAVPAGEGAIVREGARKLAVFREPGGEVHVRSAVCTHLGCLVAWNSTERTWDCPCHGSRFDVEGRAVNGPAVSPLAVVEEAEAKR